MDDHGTGIPRLKCSQQVAGKPVTYVRALGRMDPCLAGCFEEERRMGFSPAKFGRKYNSRKQSF